MSQSIPAFIRRRDSIETRLMSIPSPAADREDALNSGVPGIGVMSPPVGVTSANPVENPQPVGTKLDLDERGSSTESTNLSSSRGLHRGPPRFANVLITNSDWRYCSDRPLSARSARSRSDWCRTQMPGSKVTKRDTNTYSRGLKHGTHSRIRSAAAKLGYQPGPALIDLETGQGLAVDAASMRDVASFQGLCHDPTIARADSNMQAGTEGSPGIWNFGPVLVLDHEGTIQQWFSILKRAYYKIIGYYM